MVKLRNQPGIKKMVANHVGLPGLAGRLYVVRFGSILRIQVAGRREIHRGSCGHGCDQTLSTWRFLVEIPTVPSYTNSCWSKI